MSQSLHFHVVDQHPDFGYVLQQEVAPYFEEPIILTYTDSLLETVTRCKKQCPHLLILSTEILPKQIIPTLLNFRKICSMSKIILRLTAQDVHFQQDNWKMLVHGGVLKSDPVALWLPVILSVLDGINNFSPTVRHHLSKNQNQQQWPPSYIPLSNRDWRILTLLGQGQGNQQIAKELGLSHKTIRNRLTLIYKTIRVQSRTEAMSWAIQHGLSVDEP